MRRAGLDYLEYAHVKRHASWAAFIDQAQPNPQRMFAMTTKATRWVHQQTFQADDWLVFGCETKGLPPDVAQQFAAQQKLKLPMLAGQRSLNLSNAVAVAVYEAWRQIGFEPLIS